MARRVVQASSSEALWPGRYQAVPNLALLRRLIGIGRNGFYWRTDERLNGGRSRFRAAHGGVCRLRNVHLCRWRFWQHGPRVPRLRAHRSSLTACRGRRCLGVAKTIGCQCATEKRERCDKQCSPQGLWGARRATGNCFHSTVLADRLSLVPWSWSRLVPSEGPPVRTRGETAALDPKRAKVLL